MLSHLHATVTEMFRHRPAFAAEVLTDVLDVPLPEHTRARLGSAEVAELSTSEHRADAVVLLGDDEETRCAVVVEVQRDVEHDKRWTWPLYVAGVRRRWRCPTMLLVVCTEDAIARWAQTPIELGGPSSRLSPLVIGPQAVPLISDPAEAARTPELTVLAALAHPHDADEATLHALLGASAATDDEVGVEYIAAVLAVLPERTRAQLEELMSTEAFPYYESAFTRRLQAEGRAEGRVEGRVEGAAAILLRILERRGVDVSEGDRARITACTDLDQVEAWSDRALTATTIENVFDTP